MAHAKALGASYPEGANAVGLLLDMLDDDDPTVREAAAQSLVALGRKGLAELVRHMTNARDPGYPALLKIGEMATRLGAALTLRDLCEPMFADQPTSRRAGAAVAILTASFPTEDRDSMIDTLTILLQTDSHAGVTAMASAGLAVLGWTVVADRHPASADEVRGLVPLLGHPDLGALAACVIALLRPRADWPEHVANYGYGLPKAGPRESPEPVDTLRVKLRELESAPARTDGPEPGLFGVLYDLRSKKSAAAAAKPELEELLLRVHGALRVEVANTLLAVVPTETEAPARALGEVLLHPKDAVNEVPLRDAPVEAIAILAGMGTAARPAIPGLIAVLGWPEDQGGRKNWRTLNSKRVVASILGHLGAKEAVSALKALSGHGDVRLRYRASTALLRIGSS
jgi:hypothetical protein